MSMLKVLTVAALAVSTAAAAHPVLSDAQYLAAARCQALMSSPALGKVDTQMIDLVLRTEAATNGRPRPMQEVLWERAQ